MIGVEAYAIVLLITMAVTVALALFFMDEYVKNILKGIADVSPIVFGSLFMIILFFVFAFILSKSSTTNRP